MTRRGSRGGKSRDTADSNEGTALSHPTTSTKVTAAPRALCETPATRYEGRKAVTAPLTAPTVSDSTSSLSQSPQPTNRFTSLAALAGTWSGRVYIPSAAVAAAVASTAATTKAKNTTASSVSTSALTLPPPPYPHNLHSSSNGSDIRTRKDCRRTSSHSSDVRLSFSRRGPPCRSGFSPARATTTPMLPSWASPAASTAGGYAFDEAAMSCELFDFSNYLALRPHECAQRAALMEQVEAAAATLWPTAAEVHLLGSPMVTTAAVVSRDLLLYGSYALGLSLPSSDVDVCVALGYRAAAYMAGSCATSVGSMNEATSPGESDMSTTNASSHSSPPARGALSSVPGREQHQLGCLYDLADALLRRHNDDTLRLEVHDQCRVPVIKLQDLRTGVRADVSVMVRVPVAVDAGNTMTGAETISIKERSGEAVSVVDKSNDACVPPVFAPLPIEEAVRLQRAWLRGCPAAASTPASPNTIITSTISTEVDLSTRAEDAFPAVARMLILVTKAALRQWGLNDLFTGGVCSTALYSLTHRYLQFGRRRHRDMNCSRTENRVDSDMVREKDHHRNRSKSPSTSSSVLGSIGATTTHEGGAEDLMEGSCGQLSMTSPTVSTAPGLSEDGRVHTPAPCFPTRRRAHTNASRSSSNDNPSNHGSGSSRLSVTASDDHADSAEAEVADTRCNTPIPSTRPALAAPTSPSSPSSSAASSCSAWDCSATPPEATATDSPYEGCLVLFGVSPARLLLNFWRYLSADAFMFGYGISDAFTSTTAAAAATTSTVGCDLTAPSFRIPELLALLRCTCSQLEEMTLPRPIHGNAGPLATAVTAAMRHRRHAPSPLSLILADPRGVLTRR